MCFGQAAGGETAHPDARLLRRDSPRRRWAALSLPEVSHFDDDAMPEQMRQIVHCLYRLQVKAGILISKAFAVAPCDSLRSPRLVINGTSFGATSQASGWDTQNTRVSAPDGVNRRDNGVGRCAPWRNRG